MRMRVREGSLVSGGREGFGCAKKKKKKKKKKKENDSHVRTLWMLLATATCRCVGSILGKRSEEVSGDIYLSKKASVIRNVYYSSLKIPCLQQGES